MVYASWSTRYTFFVHSCCTIDKIHLNLTKICFPQHRSDVRTTIKCQTKAEELLSVASRMFRRQKVTLLTKTGNGIFQYLILRSRIAYRQLVLMQEPVAFRFVLSPCVSQDFPTVFRGGKLGNFSVQTNSIFDNMASDITMRCRQTPNAEKYA